MTPRTWILEDEMFGSRTIVIHCSSSDLEETFVRVRDSLPQPSKARLWDEDDKTDLEHCEGMTFLFGGPSTCVWVSDDVKHFESVLAHEFIHAAEHCLSDIGIKPKDEVLAYFIGWLHKAFYSQSEPIQLGPHPLPD